MAVQADEVKVVAARLLAGLLANPHIYTQISEGAVEGQQEQRLITLSIDLAEGLIRKVQNRSS